MNRTTWLQDRRMEKFCDVLSRWTRRELSALDASQILGCSERQFRRYRRRYEEEGLTGLFDKRLGKASARRVRARRPSTLINPRQDTPQFVCRGSHLGRGISGPSHRLTPARIIGVSRRPTSTRAPVLPTLGKQQKE
jgi:hypothetical protein